MKTNVRDDVPFHKSRWPYSWFFEYQTILDGKVTHYRRVMRIEKYVDRLCSFLCRFRRVM